MAQPSPGVQDPVASGGQQVQQPQQDEPRTLWIGDLQYWMDENYLWTAFSHTGEVHSVKVIRNKATHVSEGYGFIEMVTHAAAERVLGAFAGALMPQTDQPYRLNWASLGPNDRRQDGSNDPSIFVGDLAHEVTDATLSETFREHYPSVKSAKVVMDIVSGRSKGYGFVRFASEEERDRALNDMNGQPCAGRPMRISLATPRKPPPSFRGQQQQQQQQQQGPPPYQQQQQGSYGQAANDRDTTNTTIFVGGLDAAVTEDQLRQAFEQFGELVYVKIPFGKGCGFVQFQQRPSAEAALTGVHGTVIGAQAVRLSWGRNPSKPQRGGPGGGGGGGGWQHQPPPHHDPGAWHHQHMPPQHGFYYPPPQAYDQYGYPIPQEPGYGYGGYSPQPAFAAYSPQAPQAGQAPAAGGEQRPAHPVYPDPLAPPNISSMNTAYVAAHEPTLVSQHVWIPTPGSTINA